MLSVCDILQEHLQQEDTFAVVGVTAVRSYPLDQDLVNRFNETVDDKSDVYRLPDIKDESVFWASRIELSVEL
ncbi:hypothetical protein BDZ94DRAFT_1255900 [Collybia nuda]|uniref:Uncharacterized protein n=1 Tax=Collybia nuda TaxID=64659 RepID=A0A9P5YB82_9AGAR|nr:hypothetical protein BDZ94DRAFT_1255900 [Collybia nuda]